MKKSLRVLFACALVLGLAFISLLVSKHFNDKVKYKDTEYLSIDSVYKTPTEKIHFSELKKAFLSCWLDTDNCYASRIREWFGKSHKEEFKPGDFLRIDVDNILHSSKYDTVLVLLAFNTPEDKEHQINIFNKARIMAAIIDSAGRWHFKCKSGGVALDNDQGGDRIAFLELENRRFLISFGCLDENKRIASGFLRRFFTSKNKVPLPND